MTWDGVKGIYFLTDSLTQMGGLDTLNSIKCSLILHVINLHKMTGPQQIQFPLKKINFPEDSTLPYPDEDQMWAFSQNNQLQNLQRDLISALNNSSELQ